MTQASILPAFASLNHGVEPTPLATRLILALALLMAAQALLGRLDPSAYRDGELIASTWIGNDWLTLLVAVPLILLGLQGAGTPRL